MSNSCSLIFLSACIVVAAFHIGLFTCCRPYLYFIIPFSFFLPSSIVFMRPTSDLIKPQHHNLNINNKLTNHIHTAHRQKYTEFARSIFKITIHCDMTDYCIASWLFYKEFRFLIFRRCPTLVFEDYFPSLLFFEINSQLKINFHMIKQCILAHVFFTSFNSVYQYHLCINKH